MPDKFTYLLVDLMCIIFPFAFSFHPKIKFYKQLKFAVVPWLISSFVFLLWDILFTRAGIWSFNTQYIIGANFFGLPVEEYLFFLCIPYACIFTYYCIDLFFNLTYYTKAAKIVTLILILFLAAIALLHLPQLYTSLTFIFLALFLLSALLLKKAFFPAFYISFSIILIPFFISNGILTGTGLAEPVVLYNNHYNLGIRMFTIPFEDIFYGMLLFLMNVTGFDYLVNRKSNTR